MPTPPFCFCFLPTYHSCLCVFRLNIKSTWCNHRLKWMINIGWFCRSTIIIFLEFMGMYYERKTFFIQAAKSLSYIRLWAQLFAIISTWAYGLLSTKKVSPNYPLTAEEKSFLMKFSEVRSGFIQTFITEILLLWI